MPEPIQLVFSLPPSARLVLHWAPQFPEPYEQFRTAIQQFGDILVRGTIVPTDSLLTPPFLACGEYHSMAVATRSNNPEVTIKLSVLIGSLFERFPQLRRVNIGVVR